jgi:hypothetical protein
MGLLDVAIAHSDQADLVILNHVETLRDQIQPATPSAVASLIGGAPPVEIARRLDRLSYYGALELNASSLLPANPPRLRADDAGASRMVAQHARTAA